MIFAIRKHLRDFLAIAGLAIVVLCTCAIAAGLLKAADIRMRDASAQELEDRRLERITKPLTMLLLMGAAVLAWEGAYELRGLPAGRSTETTIEVRAESDQLVDRVLASRHAMEGEHKQTYQTQVGLRNQSLS